MQRQNYVVTIVCKVKSVAVHKRCPFRATRPLLKKNEVIRLQRNVAGYAWHGWVMPPILLSFTGLAFADLARSISLLEFADHMIIQKQCNTCPPAGPVCHGRIS